MMVAEHVPAHSKHHCSVPPHQKRKCGLVPVCTKPLQEPAVGQVRVNAGQSADGLESTAHRYARHRFLLSISIELPR